MKVALPLVLILSVASVFASSTTPPGARNDPAAEKEHQLSGCQLVVPLAASKEESCPANLTEIARFPICANFHKDNNMWVNSPLGGVTLGRSVALHQDGSRSEFGLVQIGGRALVDAECATTRGGETELSAAGTLSARDVLCCPK